MKYFIFRNHTIEPLFAGLDAGFSGYDDITIPQEEIDNYLWFYQPKFNPDNLTTKTEIQFYYNQIRFLLDRLPPSKNFIIFTLFDFLNSTKWQNSNNEITSMIYDFNNNLYLLGENSYNLKIIDITEFLFYAGRENLVNWKYYYTALMSINPALSNKFQKWFLKKIDAILSKRKKCLVLDLDNTLWGGIIGEDGIEGISLGNSYPGNCYKDFQVYLKEASKKGIMLSLCSKNNEADVLKAFITNPNMVLSMADFVAYKVNWHNKASNIRALADELNIGLDSMVFIDDNPVERDFVKTSIPEITVPDFPAEPYNIVHFFTRVLDQYFQIYKLTSEDEYKTSQYKENSQRNSFRKDFGTIDEYLKNLELQLVIQTANNFNVPRLAQMTQKTNQFNLTTKRYSESDLYKFIENGDTVICGAVKDKFGDNGITILSIVIYNRIKKCAEIDTFLLSCRILGRGIERAFLRIILNHIYSIGIRKVEATYLKTEKNLQTIDFYEKNGFTISYQDGQIKKYLIELTEEFKIESYYNILYKES